MSSLQSLERRVLIEESFIIGKKPKEPDILIDFDKYSFEYKILSSETNKWIRIRYEPYPTLLQFHQDKSLVKLVIGPFGSGKTSGMLAEIIFHASAMPHCKDGVRRSRIAIVRNTYDDLKGTTLESWIAWFGGFGHQIITYKPIRINLSYYDQYGLVEAKLIFLALDQPDQLRTLFSNEFSMAYFNEAQFIERTAYNLIIPRLGRYPKKDQLPIQFARYKKLIMDSNPPDEDHWIYKTFEIDKPDDRTVFKQPPGLIKDPFGKWVENPDRENIKGLGDNSYYTDAARGQDEEYIKVYCLGQYGMMKDGKLVFPNFSADIHVSKVSIEPNRHFPLYLGFDFGLTPACCIQQVDSHGRIYTLDEIVTYEMDLKQMLDNLVMPLLSSKFNGFKIEASLHDPSGMRRMETDSASAHEMLKSYGLNPIAAWTNNIEPRIRSVNKFVDKIILGKPAYLLDGTNCPTLKKSFLKEYKYRRMLVGGSSVRYADKPDKNDYSHIMDALQYVMGYFDQHTHKKEYSETDFNYRVPTSWGM